MQLKRLMIEDWKIINIYKENWNLLSLRLNCFLLHYITLHCFKFNAPLHCHHQFCWNQSPYKLRLYSNDGQINSSWILLRFILLLLATLRLKCPAINVSALIDKLPNTTNKPFDIHSFLRNDKNIVIENISF